MGLLVLRLAASFNSIAQGLLLLVAVGVPSPEFKALGVIWGLLGASLLIGFLTPICSGLAALGGAGVAFSLLPLLPSGNLNDKFAAIDFIVMTLALVFLGPGAFSIDARLFGRREIIIRDLPRPPRD